MIKRLLLIIFSVLFILTKKIFIKENRIPNKFMDNLSDKLHSLFIFTSLPAIYLLWFDIKIEIFSINTLVYILLFLQLVIITRYYNQRMLVSKKLQVGIIKRINKFNLLIFIFNWIVLSFGLAFLFLIVILINNVFYLFIINQIKKQKEQTEFKQQFGDGNYSKGDIVKQHIENLFEANLSLSELTKQDVKKQYRLMAKKYHPDVHKGDDKDKFSSIHLSYKFLMDFVK